MKRSGIYFTAVIIAVSCLFMVPGLVSAQPDLSTLSLPVLSSGGLIPVLERLLAEVLLVIGIIAFFYLLYAGYSYLSAGGDPAKASKAAGTIVNVVIGIILIAVSYVLLTFVIGKTRKLNGPNSPSPTTQTGNTQARPRTGSNSGSNTGQPSTSGSTTSSNNQVTEDCPDGTAVSSSGECVTN